MYWCQLWWQASPNICRDSRQCKLSPLCLILKPLTVSSCKLFFFFFFFLPQQLESTSLLGDSLPSRPSSSCPPISRDGGSSSSRRYDRFLRVQIQFSTIWRQAEGEVWVGFHSGSFSKSPWQKFHNNKQCAAARYSIYSQCVVHRPATYSVSNQLVMEPKGLQSQNISTRVNRFNSTLFECWTGSASETVKEHKVCVTKLWCDLH